MEEVCSFLWISLVALYCIIKKQPEKKALTCLNITQLWMNLLLNLPTNLFVDKGQIHFRSRTWSKSEIPQNLWGTPLRAAILFCSWLCIEVQEVNQWSDGLEIQGGMYRIGKRILHKISVLCFHHFTSLFVIHSPNLWLTRNFCKVKIAFMKAFSCHRTLNYFPATSLH